MARKKGEEPHVKARRTSLSSKTNEELINIILRKDKTERSNNSKIATLDATVKELERRTEVQAYDELLKESNELKETLAAATEANEVLNSKIDKYSEALTALKDKYDKVELSYENEISRLKDKCNVLQKTVWVSTVLIVIGAITIAAIL